MKNFFRAIFSDREWDWDGTKIFGGFLIICGVVGFFFALPEWAIMMGIGSTMAATGKFSKEG